MLLRDLLLCVLSVLSVCVILGLYGPSAWNETYDDDDDDDIL